MMREPDTIYVVKPAHFDGPYKIGSTSSLWRRLRQIRNASPFYMDLVAQMPGNRRVERQIHAHLLCSHLRCEWFRPSEKLLRLVDEISAGTLDVDSLPDPIGVTSFRKGRPFRWPSYREQAA